MRPTVESGHSTHHRGNGPANPKPKAATQHQPLLALIPVLIAVRALRVQPNALDVHSGAAPSFIIVGMTAGDASAGTGEWTPKTGGGGLMLGSAPIHSPHTWA